MTDTIVQIQPASEKQPSAGTIKYFDYSLLFIIIFLVGFGLVMLYSVSAYEGQSVFNDPTHYLKRQAFSVVVGFGGMLLLTYFPQKWIKNLTGLIYALSFFLCLAVFAIGKSSNGSARWLKIGPIQLQPSEISKIAVILTMALLLSKVPKQIKDFKSIIKVLIPAGIMAVCHCHQQSEYRNYCWGNCDYHGICGQPEKKRSLPHWV